MAEGPKTDEYEFTDDDLAKDDSWRPPTVPDPIDSAEEYADYSETLKKYKEVINSAGLHDDITETRLPTGAKKLEDNDKLDIDFDAANKAFLEHLPKRIDEILNSDFFKAKIGNQKIAGGETTFSDALAAARKETQDELAKAKITNPLVTKFADLETVAEFLDENSEPLDKFSRNDKVLELRKLLEQSFLAREMNLGGIDLMRLTSPEIMPGMRRFLNEHVEALKTVPLKDEENFNQPRFLAALSKLDDKEQTEFQTKFKINVPFALGKIGEQLGTLAQHSPEAMQDVARMQTLVALEIQKMSLIELQAFLNKNKAAIGLENDIPLNGSFEGTALLLAHGKALEYYSQETLQDKDAKEIEAFKAQKATFQAINKNLPPYIVAVHPETGEQQPFHLAQISGSYYGLKKLFPEREDIPTGPEVIGAYMLGDYQKKLAQFQQFYGFQAFEPGFTEEALKNPLFLDAYQTSMAAAAKGIADNKERLAKLTFTDEEKSAIQKQFGATVDELKASVAKLGTTEATSLDISKAGILVTSAQFYKKLDPKPEKDGALINHGSVITYAVQSGPVVQAAIAAAQQARSPAPKPGEDGKPGETGTPKDSKKPADDSTTTTTTPPPVTEPLITATPEQAKAAIIYGQKALLLEPGKKIGDTEFKLEHWGKLDGESNPTLAALKQRFLAEYAIHRGTIAIPGASKAGFKPEDASAEDMMLFMEGVYKEYKARYKKELERFALLESKHETALENNATFEKTLREKLRHSSTALQDEALESLKTGELSKARTKEEIAKTALYQKLRKELGDDNSKTLDADLWDLQVQMLEIRGNILPPNARVIFGHSMEEGQLRLDQLKGLFGLSTYNATGTVPRELIFNDPDNVRGPGEYAEQLFDDRLFDPEVYNQLNSTGEVSMTFLEYDPEIKKAIDFLGYGDRKSLNPEEVGKIAQIRMLDVAQKYGVTDQRQLSSAIFSGTYVPYQEDLALVHEGFGKPPRDQIPADYIKVMTDAGLDPYDELNLQGVIARWRNEKFNERYGQPDEARALKYGHRIGYFRKLNVPEGKTVEEIRASLQGDDLALFNRYITSLQKVSAHIYFDMLPEEYNDLRWGKKYRDKTLEIINGKKPELEQKPAPEAKTGKKAETTESTTKPAITKEEAAAALPRSKFAEDNSANLTGAAKEFYILASGFNEQAPNTDKLRDPLYHLKDLDGFLEFMKTATEDQIANVFDLNAIDPGNYGPGHNPKLAGMAQNQMSAKALAWAAITGDSEKIRQVREAITNFTSDKYKFDAVKIIGNAPLYSIENSIKEISINNPGQLFAHYKLWKDHVFKGLDDGPLKEKLSTTAKLGENDVYVTFLGSLAAAKSTGKAENLQTALKEWEKIAKDAGLPFDKMLISASPYIGESGAHRDKNGADNLTYPLDRSQAGKVEGARALGEEISKAPAHIVPTGAPAPTHDLHQQPAVN